MIFLDAANIPVCSYIGVHELILPYEKLERTILLTKIFYLQIGVCESGEDMLL